MQFSILAFKHGRDFLILAVLMTSCRCAGGLSSHGDNFAKLYKSDETALTNDLKVLTESGHPFGSIRQQEVKAHILKRAKEYSTLVYEQSFTSEIPIRNARNDGPSATTQTVNGFNIYARANLVKNPSCVVLIGSHYDTKILATTDYKGANDSGSSSALLLDLLRHVTGDSAREHADHLGCDLVFVWFDGEESVLDGWNDWQHSQLVANQDNTYGSRHAVSQLVPCPKEGLCLPGSLASVKVAALILLDMIGDPNLMLSRDRLSDKKLVGLLETILESMNLSALLSKRSKPIFDDHIPFLEAGIPAIDLIDFENINHWHNQGDILESLSLERIATAGQIALNLALHISSK